MKNKYLKFDTQLLYDYTGDNPFIKKLHDNYCVNSNLKLSDFQNEYLIKNFRYEGYSFDKLNVKVGDITENRIKKDFNLNRPIPEVTIDKIVGETDEWYHVKGNSTYFWLNKSEVGDLYKLVYMQTHVNVDELNKHLHPKSLFKHQEEGVRFLVNQKKGFLLDTVGAGKTYTSIGGVVASECKKVLIVCLSGKKIDWRKELAVWGLDSKIISGHNGWIEDDIRFTIINFDIIHKYNETGRTSKKTPVLNKQLYNEKYDGIIVDEIQNIKSLDAKRSKAIASLTAAPWVKCVYGLSATPIEKNEEFLNICLNLNISIGDIIYNKSDYHFNNWFPKKEQYIVDYCYGHKVIPKDTRKRPFWVKGKKINGVKEFNSNTYELHQRIKHKIRRRRTEKVIEGFPNKIRERMWYDLNSKEQREYEFIFENYVIAKSLMRKAEKLLIKGYISLLENLDNSRIDVLYYGFVNQFNQLKDLGDSFHEGYEKMVCKYIDGISERLKKASERKQEINETLDVKFRQQKKEEFENQLLKWKNVDLSSSRELIETGLLRQYVAIKKVPHTVSLIKNKIECGKSCIVFTHYIEEFELLVKALGDSAVAVRSGWTPKKKHEAVEEFMTNDKKKVIIGNIKTIGTGLNITKADVVIFNSPNWNGGEHIQAEGRTWRIGREKEVIVYYQIFENTIEERVFNKAESKKENSSIFNGEEIETIED